VTSSREEENWDPGQVFIDGRNISRDTWFDDGGRPFQPQVHYFVSGATKMYGAALYRLRPADFGEIKHERGAASCLTRRTGRPAHASAATPATDFRA
jgi:hypothetical protein